MKDNLTPIIIDTTYFSNGFPQIDYSNIIRRDNYISLLEDKLNNNKIVFLEGDEDAGKTILCGEFLRKNVSNSISVFFNPFNSMDFQIEYFYANMISQLRFVLGEDISKIESNIDFGLEVYRNLFFQLRKKIKQSRFYIILDGLEINNDNKKQRNLIYNILESLPNGDENFKYIFTGDAEIIKEIYPSLKKNQKIPTDSITLVGFNRSEIKDFLLIEKDEEVWIDEIVSITKGYPGRLETCRKLLNEREQVINEILDSKTYTSWIELNCSFIDVNDINTNLILSLLSLTNNSFTLDDLSLILKIELNEIKRIIDEIKILKIDNNKVYFISSSYKKYYNNILKAQKPKINEILIGFYSSNESIYSKLELSQLYAEEKDWKKILKIVDENFIVDVINITENLERISQLLDLAFEASSKLNNYTNLFKYSIQHSIINELDNFTWESEILARISLNDFSGAITLAESSLIKLNRLRLLCLIAKKQKIENEIVDEELESLILELYKSTDLSNAGDKIYDIVSDLMYSMPNLAIEIIEKSSGEASDKSINDWIVAKLSISAINSASINKKTPTVDSSSREILEKINNPNSRKISRAINFLVGNYSSGKVLEEVKKISDSKERLKLLRLWITNNKNQDENLHKVIENALDELLESSSESIISLEILKDLSLQLPYVNNKEKRNLLFKRLQGLDSYIKNIGLTKDKIEYEINMFHVQYSISNDKSLPLLINILKDIELITDLLVKVESYANLYSKLYHFKSDLLIGQKKFIYAKLNIYFEELLKITANQFDVCSSILAPISKVNPKLCLKLCSKINTLINRDRSRLNVFENYLNNNVKNIKIEILKDSILEFETPFFKNIFLRYVLERYAESKNLHYKIIYDVFFFLEELHKSKVSVQKKVHSHILFYQIMGKNETIKNDKKNFIRERINYHLDKIEEPWKKIEIGYYLCSELSQIDIDYCKQIFEECKEIKEKEWMSSEFIARNYLTSLSIVIKAYEGLVMKNKNTESHYKKVENLVNKIPSEKEKLDIWTEICLLLILNEEHNLTKKIYDEHLFPIFQGIAKNQNLEFKSEVFIAIYYFNPEVAEEHMANMNSLLRDEAYYEICEFFISKKSPYLNYQSEISKYKCSHSDISKAIKIIDKIDSDNILYRAITQICLAIKNNSSGNFTNTQIIDFSEKLLEVVKKKLPSKTNIKHDGYKLVSEIKIHSMNNSFNQWESIYQSILNIPNLSDAILIKSIFLEHFPPKLKTISKQDLFNQIAVDLKNISSHYEFVGRINDISKTMFDVNKKEWKKIFSEAFSLAKKFESGSEVYNSQKDLIDTMYRLDPNFSSELLSTIDSFDKTNNMSLLKNYHESLELEKKIINNQNIEQQEVTNSRIVIKSITNALAALNSEKITIKRIDEVSKYLYIGNKVSFQESLPLYLYYFTNCNKMLLPKNSKSQYDEVFEANFDEAIKSTSLIESFAIRKKSIMNEYTRTFIDQTFDLNLALKPKTREKGISYIQEWMLNNVKDYIIVIDPFFSPKDIEILKLIKQVGRNEIVISIIGNESYDENEFLIEWNKISQEQIPFVNIIFCAVGTQNKSPIHDRWILTKEGGLRLGTSFNSIGIHKESEISIMNMNEAFNIFENTIKGYLDRTKRELNGERIKYKSLSL